MATSSSRSRSSLFAGTTRRRGRPSGSTQQTQWDMEAKRGPGRPAGSKNKVKRGPGRPKGSTASAVAARDTGIKRGPGRPKGSTSSAGSTGVKRGPGRPKSLTSAVRGALSAIGIKRGPGRPPGSKNKVKRGPGRPRSHAMR